MTTEELWELFPIILTEPRPEWRRWYAEERARLAALLPPGLLSIHHIGSTAIQGIWAKPIVDMLAEVPEGTAMAGVKDCLIRAGYTCMSEGEGRMSFNRGYTPEGFADKVFHLHLRCAGDNDELYFRDYMNAHPELARQYEALKLSLWKRFEHHRDGYTDAKSAFVAAHTAAAKKLLRCGAARPPRA